MGSLPQKVVAAHPYWDLSRRFISEGRLQPLGQTGLLSTMDAHVLHRRLWPKSILERLDTDPATRGLTHYVQVGWWYAVDAGDIYQTRHTLFPGISGLASIHFPPTLRERCAWTITELPYLRILVPFGVTHEEAGLLPPS